MGTRTAAGRENTQSRIHKKICGTKEILMKNVRYNGDPNEKFAGQWEPGPPPAEKIRNPESNKP